MEMHFKLTLYHNLAIPEVFFTKKAKTEAQSTEFNVTPDKMATHALHMRGQNRLVK